MYYIYRGIDSLNLVKSDSVDGRGVYGNYMNLNIENYNPNVKEFVQIRINFPNACDAKKTNILKASSGPFSQSLSNLEDNRLKEGTGIIDNYIKEFSYEIYPNPYSSYTNINYILQKSANIELSVFNVLGIKVTEIVSEQQTAGNYHYTFDQKNESFYYIKLMVDGKSVSKKVIYLK